MAAGTQTTVEPLFDLKMSSKIETVLLVLVLLHTINTLGQNNCRAVNERNHFLSTQNLFKSTPFPPYKHELYELFKTNPPIRSMIPQ